MVVGAYIFYRDLVENNKSSLDMRAEKAHSASAMVVVVKVFHQSCSHGAGGQAVLLRCA